MFAEWAIRRDDCCGSGLFCVENLEVFYGDTSSVKDDFLDIAEAFSVESERNFGASLATFW